MAVVGIDGFAVDKVAQAVSQILPQLPRDCWVIMPDIPFDARESFAFYQIDT
jgi:hypothetical protein